MNRITRNVSNADTNRTKVVRLALLGKPGVGKSSIVNQFVFNTFSEESDPSIVEVHEKQAIIDGVPYILEILDTAPDIATTSGIAKQHLQGIDGYMFVYSVVDEKSLLGINEIRSQVRNCIEQRRDYVPHDDIIVPMILVANKCDLKRNENEQYKLRFNSIAHSYDIPIVDTSAKTGYGIKLAFETIVREIHGPKPDQLTQKKTYQQRLSALGHSCHKKCNIM
uniref:G domain-containing protein n=1 Tax=Panagrellus redivivus TaxID=6233 RepID=A0A7E4W318_PANRE